MGTQICVSHLILMQELLCQLMEGQGQSCVPCKCHQPAESKAGTSAFLFPGCQGANSGQGGAGESKGRWPLQPGGPALQRRENVMCRGCGDNTGLGLVPGV